MNSEIRFYLSILTRRLPLIVIITAVFTSVAVYVAMTLPTTYRADALLLVESPQIPGELAASTVGSNLNEQLEIIEQRLMTRANLLDIADDLDVFPNRSEMAPDDIVEEMRARTTFRRSIAGGRSNAANTMTVAFTADRPAVTANVTNEYVTRILQENVEIRTGMAEQTLEFFEQEVDRLGEELDRQSARILEFKNQNIDALPEGMEYRMSRQSLLTERLAQLERDRDGLLEQRKRMVEIFEATGRVAGVSQSLSPEQQQLQSLQDQLESAKALYSEQNPRVRVLMARIDQLESQIASQGGATDSGLDPNEALLNLQLGEIDSRLEFIEEQRSSIEAELERLAEAIARTPANSITLQALERDYSNIQSRYSAATGRLATAAMGERIELTSKGQRISVLRQATVPRSPASPNRPLIVAGGFAGAFGLALALVVLLELLNRTVRRPADLTRALQITPLATVPYIATRNESFRKRGALMAVVALIAVGLPAALYLLHVQYMPLDLLADRAMSRIGL